MRPILLWRAFTPALPAGEGADVGRSNYGDCNVRWLQFNLASILVSFCIHSNCSQVADKTVLDPSEVGLGSGIKGGCLSACPTL